MGEASLRIQFQAWESMASFWSSDPECGARHGKLCARQSGGK